MKKLIIVFIFMILGITSCSLYMSGTDERKINQYMKKKYNREIKIVYKANKNEGNMGDVWHTVALKENEKVKFGVHVDGFIFTEVLEDDYELGMNTYKEYQKIKPYTKEINKMGFVKLDKRDLVEYEKEYDEKYRVSGVNNILNLAAKKSFKYERFFEYEEQLTQLMDLVELVQESGAAIHTIEITDEKTLGGSYFTISDVATIKTKDDLIRILKKENPEFMSYAYVDQLAEELMELKNERFDFKREGEDEWLRCWQADEEGDCTEFSIHITYNKNGLSATNPNLKEDIFNIVYFFNINLTVPGKSSPHIDFVVREPNGDNRREIFFSNIQFSDQSAIEQFIESELK